MGKNKQYYVNFLCLFLLIFFNDILEAKNNNPEDFFPYMKIGDCLIEEGYYRTNNNGQLFITKRLKSSSSDNIETQSETSNNTTEKLLNNNIDTTVFDLRLKQNTIIVLSKDPLALTDELELKSGIIGLKAASDTVLIKTVYADVRLRNATVVIKLTDNLFRLCVIKGTAIFIKKANFIPVEASYEIAASKDKISKQYKFLDDLRYVWYWKTPEEEPSLKE